MVAMTVTKKQEIDVRYLRAECGVRYWEDGTVDGETDEEGKIPLRKGDCWCPVIDIDAGQVLDWPEGTTAKVHYKVCDAGRYALLDADNNVVVEKDGYVPKMMSPADNGYGDYVIMNIDEHGKIDRWRIDLAYFDESN